MMDGFQYNFIQDLDFNDIMNQDLIDGQHRNKEGKSYFTTSFFHSIEELKNEVMESGFELSGLFAIESFAEYIPDIQNKIVGNKRVDSIGGCNLDRDKKNYFS
jgi:hypothetical protein